MQFVVIARDYQDADAFQRRQLARQDHLALGDTLSEKGHLLYAAALLNDDKKMNGSVMVMDFESRATLDAWLSSEPYVKGRVWEHIEVQPCQIAPRFANIK